MRLKLPDTFYIYEHYRPDTGMCFYVGKGRGWRAYDTRKRNKHWSNIYNKLNYLGLEHEVKILIDNLENEEAKQIEIETIALWKEAGVTLANMTNGGDGSLGIKTGPISEEKRKKMSCAWKKVSDAARLKMRKAWENRRLVGHSSETKTKTSKSMKKAWFNRSSDERSEIGKKISSAWHKKSFEEKEAFRLKMRNIRMQSLRQQLAK